MAEERSHPQINVSSIETGSGIAGAMFTVLSMGIFLIAIPALRYFLVGALALGGAAALAMRARQ